MQQFEEAKQPRLWNPTSKPDFWIKPFIVICFSQVYHEPASQKYKGSCESRHPRHGVQVLEYTEGNRQSWWVPGWNTSTFKIGFQQDNTMMPWGKLKEFRGKFLWWLCLFTSQVCWKGWKRSAIPLEGFETSILGWLQMLKRAWLSSLLTPELESQAWWKKNERKWMWNLLTWAVITSTFPVLPCSSLAVVSSSSVSTVHLWAETTFRMLTSGK